jgi:hypothetical protein
LKRYRVVNVQFDSTPALMQDEIQVDWSEEVKQLHQERREQLMRDFVATYGARQQEKKLQDFIDFGVLPFSILAFHNRFLPQIRTSFVMGAYYPALTSACTLAERILNYLVIGLRDDYLGTPEYKKVHKKASFNDWKLPIDILEAWNILLPSVVTNFRRLHKIRNQNAIHFDPHVEYKDREFALEAIGLLKEIIRNQFSGFGPQPWFIKDIRGEVFIKKSAEEIPFIKRIYLPNCVSVGPYYEIRFDEKLNMSIHDHEYPDEVITDEEFVQLRMNHTRKT